jgi:DDE family transposase
VRELAIHLPSSAWKTVRWREGTRNPLRSRFAALRIRPAHRDDWRSEPRAEEWLLIEWPSQEAEPTKYWLSTLPGNTKLRDLVRLAKHRWIVERDYQELKQELGLGHYEGRGWRGFHHHATLCIAAYGFLVAERSRFSPSARARSPPFGKPLPGFCSGNSRVVLFVEIPFYNTVVLKAVDCTRSTHKRHIEFRPVLCVRLRLPLRRVLVEGDYQQLPNDPRFLG